jgi:predicted DNA-binding transcriptional regulator YafY
MPANKNALARYITIDKCLQSRERRWTLNDLIKACSDALYDSDRKHKKIGKRTIQADIQIMRSDKLGYNAPIKVVDRKYYTYSDPKFSITSIPLTQPDLNKIKEASEILRQFKGFSNFKDLSILVQKLEDKIFTENEKRNPIIDFEKNEDLKGLNFIDRIFQAIKNKQVLEIWYQSFKASRPGKIVLHPYLLKEYRNRWFVLGKKQLNQPILTLALDRISEIEITNKLPYLEDKDFNSAEYYKDVIGVTVNSNRPVNVHLFFNHEHAPYVLTKPLHHSQQIISETKDGIEISIKVIPNFELEREILGFGENVKVVSPLRLKQRINERLKKATLQYD